MRPVIWLLLVVVIIVLIGFAGQNPSSRVPVSLWTQTYPDVRLFHVVLAAFIAGAAFSGIIGLIEGASDRLARRKLQRELTRSETETEMLRSQLASERAAGDEPAQHALPQPVPATTDASRESPAAAPVYDAD